MDTVKLPVGRFPTPDEDCMIDRDKLDAAFMSFVESIGALCAENMELREVLKFYADRENWRPDPYAYDKFSDSKALDDYGARARKALEEKE